MTLTAHRVLEDCELAVAEFAPTDDAALWRRRWIAGLTLLRTVGHVLDKVDGESDASLRVAIDDWWNGLRNTPEAHPIFWKFINEERNSIVKEYRSRGVHVLRSTVRFSMATGRQLEDTTTYLTVIQGGHYDGRSQVEVGREAVAWWHEQLRAIERGVSGAA